MYEICETLEAMNDIQKLASYMQTQFHNPEAALHFLNTYDKQVTSLKTFPFGYRGVSLKYKRYEIRMKPFDTYNIFFIVEEQAERIIILRILKDKQDWSTILGLETHYRL